LERSGSVVWKRVSSPVRAAMAGVTTTIGRMSDTGEDVAV
jgi:hypothetical protein